MSTSQKPPFTSRLYAVLIDYAIIVAYMGLLAGLAFAVYALTGRFVNWLEYGVATAEMMGFVVLVLPVGLYLYLTESSAAHATVGKRALHLQVTSSDQKRRPTKRQIAVRTVVKLFPWELAHFFVWHTVAATQSGQHSFPLWLEIGLLTSLALPVTYILIVALQPKGKGPHDLAAGTRVITVSS